MCPSCVSAVAQQQVIETAQAIAQAQQQNQ
jgi:hypothetical protein